MMKVRGEVREQPPRSAQPSSALTCFGDKDKLRKWVNWSLVYRTGVLSAMQLMMYLRRGVEAGRYRSI